MGSGTHLGFDFGLRRIGVAVGEAMLGSARPLLTLPARAGQPDWQRLQALLREWQPVALVVGIPRHADGSDSAMTAPAQDFARSLQARFDLPVHLVDERLSSHAAERELAERGRGGARLARRPDVVDSLAAAIILETWFAERPHD